MNNPLAALCEQFLKERTYLKNVTRPTIIWYQVAFKNYVATLAGDGPALPTKTSLQHFVVRQRERGVRPITCNTYIGAMNAFCAWLHEEGHLAEPLKLPKLRVEHRVLELLTEAQMRALIAYKPKSLGQWRVHLAVLLILDIGLRISDTLNLRQADIDNDNLILKVFGKGQKERLVPFSRELRKRLYRFEQFKDKKGIRSNLVFPGSRGSRWEKWNSSTSLYLLQRKLGLGSGQIMYSLHCCHWRLDIPPPPTIMALFFRHRPTTRLLAAHSRSKGRRE